MAASCSTKSGVEEEITFSVTVNLIDKSNRSKCIVKNAIRKLRRSDKWFDVFDVATEGMEMDDDEYDEYFEKNAKVSVTAKPNATDVFNADPYDTVNTLIDFDHSLKYVTINLSTNRESHDHDQAPQSKPKNAFEVLMSTNHQRKKPPSIPTDKPRFNAKERLYNHFVETEDLTFPASLPGDEMIRQTMAVVDALWYIDGSHEKINHRVDSSETIPVRFAKYNGFNDYKKKRKASPQIMSAQLNHHADILFRLSTSANARAWEDLAKDLQTLAKAVQSYARYLDISNEKQKFRQSLSQPVRQYSNHATVTYHEKCLGPIKPCYSKLDQVISECDEYTPVFFDEYLHTETGVFKDRFQKHRYIEGISLTFSIDLLSYDPGAGLGKVVFLWRVPEDRSQTEMMSSAARVHTSLEGKYPRYHTREMRKEFVRTYQGMVHIPPHMLRSIYTELTLDATASQNPAIDARIKCAIMNNDPDLAIDLRACNNGRPNETFDVFFEQLQEEVQSVTATDERRHGEIQHFSKFISVRDLIQQTSKKCPDGTPIPSESTVLLAFVPKNSYRNTAKLYKSRIQLQHKVQSRQLRSEHMDEHYCAAIFKYMRQYAVKYRDLTSMLCLDDKSKVDFGEPGMAISSGVRGKKSIVPVECILGALDHDVGSKGSLTPSVCLHIDIPEDVSESFYRGQVHVTLKDSVFQPSSPFRHAKELQQILKPSMNEETKPYLLLFTDGGPDHRVTYGAVKLSLIILFKLLNLDILIAARTAPGHSWLNPAERIMSLLNIAYQNVALQRTEMDSTLEQILRACSTMSEIRKKAEKQDGLEPAWLKAVDPMIQLLNDRIERVQLKGKTFRSGTPAKREDVMDFESKAQHLVDPDITLGQYTKNHLKNKQMYNNFMESHCRERNYVFQVRKCDVANCCLPVRNPTGVIPPFLPDPETNPDQRNHYKAFDDVLGTDTSEVDMPSSQTVSVAKVAEEQQGCPNRLLVGQNVRSTVRCYECGKPRCIYSKRALTIREERCLRRLTDRYQYSCGSVITPDGDNLQGIVFVRLQLCCQSPVEIPYYSASHITQKDLCCQCAEQTGERDAEALKTHRVVLPMCRQCTISGKDIIKRLPRKN